jgi:antitoxin FitA
MANILIRNLDPKVVTKLKKRAKSAKRSLQGEIQFILERESQFDPVQGVKAMKRIHEAYKRAGKKFSDSTKLIREDRDKR